MYQMTNNIQGLTGDESKVYSLSYLKKNELKLNSANEHSPESKCDDKEDNIPQNGVWDQLQASLSVQAESHVIAAQIGSHYINKNNDLWKELMALEEIQQDMQNDPEVIATKNLIEEKRKRREKAYEFLRKNVEREMLEEELTLLLLDFRKQESLRPKSEQPYSSNIRGEDKCRHNRRKCFSTLQEQSKGFNDRNESKKEEKLNCKIDQQLSLERKIENYLLRRVLMNSNQEEISASPIENENATYHSISHGNLKEHENLLKGLSSVCSLNFNRTNDNQVTFPMGNNCNYSLYPSPPSTARSRSSTNRSAPPRLDFLWRREVRKNGIEGNPGYITEKESKINTKCYSSTQSFSMNIDDQNNLGERRTKFQTKSEIEDDTKDSPDTSYLSISNIDRYLSRIREAFREEEHFLLESIETLTEEISNDGMEMRKNIASTSKKDERETDHFDSDDDDFFLPSTQDLREFRTTLKQRIKQVEHENSIQGRCYKYEQAASKSNFKDRTKDTHTVLHRNISDVSNSRTKYGTPFPLMHNLVITEEDEAKFLS